MRKILTIITLINLVIILSWASSESNPQFLKVKNKYGIIHCPTGEDLKVPVGTKLEVSGFKIGKLQIVKVPSNLSLTHACSYGIFKYVVKNKKGNKKGTKFSAKERKKLKKIVKIAEKMKYASSCKEKFISEDGLGPLGKYVKAELSSKKYKELLRNNKPFKEFCPGYTKMTKEEKKNVWVFVLMSMSHYESSCRPQVEAQGPNGIAKGLFQLHKGAENKYSHWDTNKVCRRGDAKDPKESLQCTLSMLNGQIDRFDSIFFNNSYWDVLRNSNKPATHASKIKSAIQMLSGCDGGRLIASNKIMRSKKLKKKL